MKKTIFSRIFKGYLLVTVTLTLFITLAAFLTLKNYYLDNLKTELIKNTELLSEIFLPILTKNDFKTLDQKVKTIAKQEQVRITVIDLNGKVLADSIAEPKTMANHATRVEVMAALAGRTGFAHHVSETLGKDMIYIAIPIKINNKIKNILRTSVFVRDINQILRPLYWHIFWAGLILLVLALVLASILARKIAAPLNDLETGVQKIARGDFSARVLLKENSEARKLVDGFNHMGEQLEQLVKELKDQQQELNIIIGSIQEGMLVIDFNGRVKLVNKSLRQSFDIKEPTDKNYWEIIRGPGLTELIDDSIAKQKNLSAELILADKNYLVATALLAGNKGLALFFRDITEFKQLEKVKKDFVVNASHELRTPLTAIKGFVETLADEIKTPEQKRYLEIINSHTERLISIVQDIMTLSELEEKNIQLKKEKVDLVKLINEARGIFEDKLEQKKLYFKVEGQADVLADSFKLQQVFINLIDNALKYTEQGGITIKLEKTAEQVIINVEDTGVGIPKDDLSRIFERFYVVDKSRARKLGGTGLGLSIVKHIILLHGGSIEVESTTGVGTRFSICLPLIKR